VQFFIFNKNSKGKMVEKMETTTKAPAVIAPVNVDRENALRAYARKLAEYREVEINLKKFRLQVKRQILL
jgi:hypothetical protein